MLLGFGLSFSIVAGWLYDQTSFLSANAATPMLIVAWGLVLSVLFYGLLVWVTREKGLACEKSAERWQPSRRDIGIAVLIFAIPQFILWLIAWPGIYGGDGPFHILQMLPTLESYTVRTKQSVIYTLMLGGAVEIGRQLGSREVAFAVVILLQMVVLIYAQVKSTIFIGKESASKKFFWVTVAFLGLHPFGILLRMYSCQDVFFCAFLVLMLIEAIQIGKAVKTGEDAQTNHAVKFIVFAMLMCLFRNNGVYFLALAVLFMLPTLLKKKLFLTTAVFVFPIALVIFITGPLYAVCGVVDSEKNFQEMSSVPSQQLSRAYAVNSESFTDEEVAEFEKFYPGITEDVSTWYWTYEEISDKSKEVLDNSAVKNDIGGYLKLYFSVGAKNVGNYLDAYMMNTLGWWYPFKHYPDSRLYHTYAKYEMVTTDYDYEGYADIQRTSVCPVADEFIIDVVMNETWSDVPVLNVFLNAGMWTWFFFTLCAIALLKRRGDMKFAFFIIAGLFLTLLLSPLCYFRYAYALITCLPLLCLVAWGTVPASPISHGDRPQKNMQFSNQI